MVAGLWSVRRVEVHGDSMRPTLEPGERLLVARTRRARPGHLVVVRDPRSADRRMVKRVVAIAGGRAEVIGDNASASTASAELGAMAVVARVLYRYHPRERAGRVW